MSNTKEEYIKVEISSMDKKFLNLWAVHYRSDNVSQPWSMLDSFDNKLSAIIKAYQISGKYFMVKVIDPDGSIIWSD